MDLGILLPVLVVAIVVAVVTGRMSSRKPSSPTASSPVAKTKEATAPPETNNEERPRQNLWEQLNPILPQAETEYQASAHPSALLTSEHFPKGVKLLSDSRFTNTQILEVAQSNSPTAACLGLEALCQRTSDPEEISKAIMENYEGGNSFILYFILKYMDARNVARSTALCLIKTQEWWESNAVAIQCMREHVKRRIPKGEVFRFEKELSGLDSDTIEAIEKFIKKLGIKELLPLSKAIETHRRQKVDLDFLNSFGQIVDESRIDEIALHDGLEQGMSQCELALDQSPPRSLVILGEAGVGKSTLLELVIEKYLQSGWTVFQAGAVEIMAGQSYIGELEQRMTTLFKNIGPEKRVVWLVPSLEELDMAGRHKLNTHSVLDLMLPHIVAEKIVIATQCEPKAFQKLVQNRPRLSSSMERIQLQPLSDAATLELAKDWITLAAPKASFESANTLQECQKLATQYLSELAAPGNVLELLKSTLGRLQIDSDSEAEIALKDLLFTLAQQTGLPSALLDDRESLDLKSLRDYFDDRVKGQKEAVDCLVDRIAMIKAGLSDPTRPLGVFLLVGPSGTGKTEIAKALATFLFGSEERMIRLDMSEYQDSSSLQKLLGGNEESDQTHSLAARIRKQPFSILLLDEFEKANQNIWDLFLQVFDDGRLTDSMGYTVNCRHCLILLTSNLGAAKEFTPSVGFGGRSAPQFDPAALDKAVKKSFRPEFVNRLDRVIVFKPLTREVMRQILRKELRDVLQRRGLRSRQWAVEWAHSAIEFLLKKGFTPDLGARPLKRAIDRYLLTPLAHAIVNRSVPEGDQFLLVRAKGNALEVEFVDPDAPAEGDPLPASPADLGQASLELIMVSHSGGAGEMKLIKSGFEEIQESLKSRSWQELKTEIYEQSYQDGFWTDPNRFETLGRMELVDRIESAYERGKSLLDRLASKKGLSEDLTCRFAQQAFLLKRAIDDSLKGRPQEAILHLRMNSGQKEFETFEKMQAMYTGWAIRRNMRLTPLHEPHYERSTDQIEAIYHISGFACHSLLERETGIHLWETDASPVAKSTARNRIQIFVNALKAPPVPLNDKSAQKKRIHEELQKRSQASPAIARRYTIAPPLVRDTHTNARTGKLDRVLEGNFDLVEFL